MTAHFQTCLGHHFRIHLQYRFANTGLWSTSTLDPPLHTFYSLLRCLDKHWTRVLCLYIIYHTQSTCFEKCISRQYFISDLMYGCSSSILRPLLLFLKFIFVYCCSIMHHVYCVWCNQCCIHIIQSAPTARTIRTIRTPIHTWRLAAWNMILSVISSCFLFCLHNLHKHLTPVKRISISVLCIHNIIYSIQQTIGRTGSV